MLVSVKIFVSTSEHTGGSLFFLIGSAGFFYVWVIIFNFVPLAMSNLLGVAESLLPFVLNWLFLFPILIAFIVIDVGMWHFDE